MGVFRKLAMAGAVFSAVLASSPVNAARWMVSAVDNGSWGGFGASGFHNTGNTGSAGVDHDNNVMTGSSLEDIDNTFVGGEYDDFYGTFDWSFHLVGTPGMELVTLESGNLFFGIPSNRDGSLVGSATMSLDISALTTAPNLTATTIGFEGGLVCCDGPNRPNSFDIADDGNTAIMALWGANGFYGTGFYGYGQDPDNLDDLSSIGLDLRLQFSLIPEIVTQVPIPASLPLFGTGLALMGYLGWRKKRKA